MKVLVFQAVRQRQGDWCDGAKTYRTLLRRGTFQRTEGLQVTNLCPFRNMEQLSHVGFALVCLCFCLKRGKLISTILDWEDALPDRDLNRADDASR